MSEKNDADRTDWEKRSVTASFRLMWSVLQDGLRLHRTKLIIAYAISIVGWIAILCEPYFISLLVDKADIEQVHKARKWFMTPPQA